MKKRKPEAAKPRLSTAVRLLIDAIDACDFSFSRWQSSEVVYQLESAKEYGLEVLAKSKRKGKVRK